MYVPQVCYMYLQCILDMGGLLCTKTVSCATFFVLRAVNEPATPPSSVSNGYSTSRLHSKHLMQESLANGMKGCLLPRVETDGKVWCSGSRGIRGSWRSGLL